MKKLLITALIAVGISASSVAQDKGAVEFGVNVGFNTSYISDSSESSDSGNGFNAGIQADYFFSDRWSLKVKAIYDQKGWDDIIQNIDNGQIRKGNINLNYITVPVMANWHFGSKRNWYLNFGPYVGFLVSAEETAFDTDLKEEFNSSDFGLAYGLGVKIPLNNKLKLFFELEGQEGFSDLFKSDDIYTAKNSRGSFNVGLNFLLK